MARGHIAARYRMPILTSDKLHVLSHAVCVASDSSAHEAALVADHLVEANLTGHDSHGVGLLPVYVDKVRAGLLSPNRHAELVSERGGELADGVARVDVDDGVRGATVARVHPDDELHATPSLLGGRAGEATCPR